MKFNSIVYAIFGLSAIASALPAPVAAPVADLDVLEKRDMIVREAATDLTQRTVVVDLVADVQVCIDAIVEINTAYSKKKPYTRGTCQSWAAEVVAKIQILISVISAYPAGCSYPSIDICVSIFVKLFVTIFVQLKVFIDVVGGLIGTILLTVDLLLTVLLGLVGDLLNILVSLCLLIEVKIQVGICAKIISGCVGLVNILYLQAFIQLCLKAGLAISL